MVPKRKYVNITKPKPIATSTAAIANTKKITANAIGWNIKALEINK